MKAVLYVLKAPEFAPIVDAATADGADQRDLGDYLAIEREGEIRIRRVDAGLIEAVWFGAATGGMRGSLTQFDADALVITAE
jgi:hypothetical protein